jgi:hypothetical protein
MIEINLEIDNQFNQTIIDLMKRYKLHSKAELIKKAVCLLKMAAIIDETDGELIARKEGKGERRIRV